MSNIKTEVNGPVGIATLNRPEALNALSTSLLDELADALQAWDRGTEVRAMIVTGSERAFAAGADIKEMAPKTFSEMYRENLFADQFDRIARVRKPIIAAVAGHALGAAANWRCCAISSSPTKPRNSASRRSRSASCPAWAVHSG